MSVRPPVPFLIILGFGLFFFVATRSSTLIPFLGDFPLGASLIGLLEGDSESDDRAQTELIGACSNNHKFKVMIYTLLRGLG